MSPSTDKYDGLNMTQVNLNISELYKQYQIKPTKPPATVGSSHLRAISVLDQG